MFRAGVAHVMIGLIWSVGPILGFLEHAGGTDGTVRPEVVAIVVLLWPIGIPILFRGVALLQQALGMSGYFRAGVDGIELRLGAPSVYARLIVLVAKIRALPANPDSFALRFPGQGTQSDGRGYVHRFRWQEIASFELNPFAFIIELRSGARLLLRRFYFVEAPVMIGRRLNEITQRLRETNPLPKA
jgi:hypothetical protein